MPDSLDLSDVPAEEIASVIATMPFSRTNSARVLNAPMAASGRGLGAGPRRISLLNSWGFLRASCKATMHPIEWAMSVVPEEDERPAWSKTPAKSSASDSILIVDKGDVGDRPWPSMSARCSWFDLSSPKELINGV